MSGPHPRIRAQREAEGRDPATGRPLCVIVGCLAPVKEPGEVCPSHDTDERA